MPPSDFTCPVLLLVQPPTRGLLATALPPRRGVRIEARARPPSGALPHLLIVLEESKGDEIAARVREIQDRASGAALVVVSRSPTTAAAVRAVQAGARDYLGVPEDLGRIGAILEEVQRESQDRQRQAELRARQQQRYDFRQILGESPAMQEVLRLAEKVIRARPQTVLIRGETGTGKELLARAIHYNSAQGGEPFVEVNCHALPETLLESELFGHEAGAFTDARARRRGLFEVAGAGTLFLDEIGSINPGLQGKLLRAIEQREIRRLGGEVSLPVQARVIAATHVDLEAAIREGRFRRDLYYRLNIVTLVLPPLRARGQDIIILARHFASRFARDYGLKERALLPASEQKLLGHPWPGNVRELRNVIERCVVMGEAGTPIDAAEIHLGSPDIPGAGESRGARLIIEIPPEGISRSAVERQLVGEVLRLCGGNRSRAARILQISRPTLIRMVEKYSLG